MTPAETVCDDKLLRRVDILRGNDASRKQGQKVCARVAGLFPQSTVVGERGGLQLVTR